MPFCSTARDRFLHELLIVEQLVGFLVDQNVVRFVHGDAPRLGAAAAKLAENVADIDGAHLRARHAGNFEHRHAAAASLHLDLDFLVVEFAVAQFLAEAFARGRARAGADQRIEHALFGRLFGARLHVFTLLLADKRNTDLDQVAHDLLDVAADIADLGEFGGFDLEERRAGKPGEAAGNLGFADACRADHQNIFRQDFLAQFVVELQSAPAVAQRDGDRTLGVALADNEAVKFGNDFAGEKSVMMFVLLRRYQLPACHTRTASSR